jgi:hypothetical protein
MICVCAIRSVVSDEQEPRATLAAKRGCPPATSPKRVSPDLVWTARAAWTRALTYMRVRLNDGPRSIKARSTTGSPSHKTCARHPLRGRKHLSLCHQRRRRRRCRHRTQPAATPSPSPSSVACSHTTQHSPRRSTSPRNSARFRAPRRRSRPHRPSIVSSRPRWARRTTRRTPLCPHRPRSTSALRRRRAGTRPATSRSWTSMVSVSATRLHPGRDDHAPARADVCTRAAQDKSSGWPTAVRICQAAMNGRRQPPAPHSSRSPLVRRAPSFAPQMTLTTFLSSLAHHPDCLHASLRPPHHHHH